jgi:hypothetical protein
VTDAHYSILCQAVTDGTGTAKCVNGNLASALGGYTAVFGADGDYMGSTAASSLVVIAITR